MVALVKNSGQYSASMTAERTLRHEMRIALSLLLETLDWTVVRRQILEQNLFQTRSLRTATTYLQQIRRRVQVLDRNLQQAYLAGTISDQNAILVYSLSASYRLPKEFVTEVVRHDWLSFKRVISKADVMAFISRKAEQSDIVARWTRKTVNNVVQVMLTYFSDCQILRRLDAGQWEITPLVISPALKSYVETTEQYHDFLKIILNA